MRFERGKDPKDAMGIGAKTQIPRLCSLYVRTGNTMLVPASENSYSVVSPRDAVSTLQQIERGHLLPENFLVERDGDAVLHPLSDYKGQHVWYKMYGRYSEDSFADNEIFILIPPS